MLIQCMKNGFVSFSRMWTCCLTSSRWSTWSGRRSGWPDLWRIRPLIIRPKASTPSGFGTRKVTSQVFIEIHFSQHSLQSTIYIPLNSLTMCISLWLRENSFGFNWFHPWLHILMFSIESTLRLVNPFKTTLKLICIHHMDSMESTLVQHIYLDSLRTSRVFS